MVLYNHANVYLQHHNTLFNYINTKEQQQKEKMIEFPSIKSSSTLEEQSSNSFFNIQSQFEISSIKDGKNNEKIQKVRTTKLKRKFKQFNHSNWSLKQNIAYKNFLKQNQILFETDNRSRRSMKINVLISHVVKTRSSDQCRSHHQKMMRWHKSIPQIISHIENLYTFFGKKQAKESMQSTAQDQIQTPNQIENVQNTQTNLQATENEHYLWEFVENNIWWDGSEF